MKPQRVAEVLESLFSTRWPPFLWGPPGVGKSSVVRAVAAKLGLPLIDLRASLLDPTDLRGIPTVEGGQARWCSPEFLPRGDGSSGILFLDELNAAPPLVQASLYQLTLDRRIGEYQLPDGWRIAAAGNRSEDGAVTFRMPSALANRFVHLEFEADFEDWRGWAVDHDIHPWVVGFLSVRKELLCSTQKAERGFPTPRSWEMASDVLKTVGNHRNAQDILVGTIGEAAAVEFGGYCDRAISEGAILKILKDPETAALPDTLGDLYALISYITFSARVAGVLEAAAFLLHRVKPEMAVLLLRNLLQKEPKFALQKRTAEFMRRHKDLIR